MKKLLVALVLTLVMLVVFTTPVFAWDNPVRELQLDKPDRWFDPTGQTWFFTGDSGIYKLVIPKGCITSPDVDFLTVTFAGGITFNLGGCDVQFSQPVTFSMVVAGGKWIEVVTFTQIVNGAPVPN